MAVDTNHDDSPLQEEESPNGERLSGENAQEALRLELDAAYCSVKLLNLEIFLMQVAGQANDFEVLNVEDKDFSNDYFEKAFELVILSGILDTEIRELEGFMMALQIEISDAHQNLSPDDSFGISASSMSDKLLDAGESMKNLQDVVADIGKQSAKFEKSLSLYYNKTCLNQSGELGNGETSPNAVKWKLQNADQQRHVLQMLEKSLARELDLDKKLSESISHKDGLKLKLHYAERELYCMEESIEICFKKMLEAENAAELFMGISKELVRKIQDIQISLNGAIQRENEIRARMEESMTIVPAEEAAAQKSSVGVDGTTMVNEDDSNASLDEVEEKFVIASSDVLALRDKVLELEAQQKDSDVQLQLANALVKSSQEQQSILSSQISQMETAIAVLKSDVSRNEKRAESAEAVRSETDKQLSEEIVSLKNSKSERETFLEGKITELEMRLEHAKASVEAGEEQQNMLYATIVDMENTIKDLKGIVVKVENKAENAESKCSLMTETNIELSEEVGFLRGRLVSLETSLNRAEDAKTATAKDIDIRTKIIADLVMKLAMEREQLQIQVSALKKNKILSEEFKANSFISPSCKRADDGTVSNMPKLAEPSMKDTQVEEAAATMLGGENGTDTAATVSAVYTPDIDCNFETSRNTEATKTDPKYIFTAIIVLLVSVMTFYMYQGSSHA